MTIRSHRLDWVDPGEREWHPESQSVSIPDVDWGPRSVVVGHLHLPGGEILVLVDEGPAFGFGRYAEEMLGYEDE